MAKKQAQKRGNKAGAGQDVEGNVDKIRDILFGSQMRDYESRFDAMEKRLAQLIAQSTKAMERRIERLDKYARREVDKLSEQIKAERKDRKVEGSKGTTELNSLAEKMEALFAEVDEQLAEESRDLRNSLHDQAEDLAAQIREAQGQLQAALEKESLGLKDTKLAREDMAELLTEMAMRLNKDFKLPKA